MVGWCLGRIGASLGWLSGVCVDLELVLHWVGGVSFVMKLLVQSMVHGVGERLSGGDDLCVAQFASRQMEPQYMGRDSAPSYKYGSGGGGGGGGGNKKAPVSDPLLGSLKLQRFHIVVHKFKLW